tara:strand:- start:7572 stop:9992 length:2421 start_codon:yes stop_codon:yes gene_type:complete
MAVEIDIDNNTVTLNNVATEETLKRLVDKMEASSSGSTGAKSFKDALKNTNEQAKSSKKLNVELKGLTKSADDLAEELDDAGKSAGSFGSKLGGMADKVMGAVEDVVKFGASTAGVGLNMRDMGTAVDKLASAIPYAGGALGAAGGAVIAHTANLSDSFDQLSRSGAAFSGNLFDIEKAAAASYLRLETFTGIVRENSASLAVFGGTARLGAKRFVDINVAMNELSRDKLRYLGISAEESAEMLGEYITMQQRNTAFANMSTRQQAMAAANYSEEITKLATLTGQDRKALAEKMARNKQEANIELMLSEMSVTGNTNTRNSLELLRDKFGDVPGAMDLVLRGMQGLSVGATAEGNLLLQSPMGEELNKLGLSMRNGTVKSEDVVKRMGAVYDAQNSQFKGMRDLQGFSPIADQMNKSVLALQGVNQQYKVISETFKGDMDAYSKSLIPEPAPETKTVKDAQMLIEDLGKTTRLGMNKVAQAAIGSMGTIVGKLKDLVDGVEMKPEEKKALTDFKDNVVLAGGAASGFAKAANKASLSLGQMAVKHADEFAVASKTVANSLVATTKATKTAIDTATKTAVAASKTTATVAGAGAKATTEAVKTTASLAGSGTKAVAAGSGSIITKVASGILKKIPILGALASGGITAATSDQDTTTGKAMEGVGSAAGNFAGTLGGVAAGAMIGSFVPIVGTAIGGIIGGVLGSIGGDTAGKKIGGWFADKFGFEDGGVIKQPTLSMIGEGASNEAVVPLPNGRNIPVDMDMAPIVNLTKSVEKLIQIQGTGSDNAELLVELKKMNRQTGHIVKLQS